MKALQARPVDRMFRALSDRTRLRILHLLLPGELCVCHLVDVLDLPQPKVSRHLAYLRRAGLVHRPERGSVELLPSGSGEKRVSSKAAAVPGELLS